MSIECLPTEILTTIVASYLPQHVSFGNYLALRLLNKRFNEVLLYCLFDLDVCGACYPEAIKGLALNEAFVLRYWKAFFQPRRRIAVQEDVNEAVDEGGLRQGYPSKSFLAAGDRLHRTQIRSALTTAIERLTIRLKSLSVSSQPNLPSGYFAGDEPTLAEKCIYALCKATICIHGSRNAWDLLVYNIEQDYWHSFTRDEFFTPSYHSDVWTLYAAVYLNDVDQVKMILESLKVPQADQALWRRRVSAEYVYFVQPKLRRMRPIVPEAQSCASVQEQKWVKSVASSLVIAASVGHKDLVAYLMQLEPNLPRNAFRTQLYRTSSSSGMGQAIANNQKEVFKLLVDLKWPLTTSTGFARTNYFNGLRVALENSHHGIDGESILGSMLNMTYDWQCSYVLGCMLHHAAKQNNIELGKLVLDQMMQPPHKMFTYHRVKDDRPRWTLGTQPREFALGTAAYYGHVEFTRFLLEHDTTSDEAGVRARDCALHSLTCHVVRTTENHHTVLKHILNHTEGLFLETALVKAATRHDEAFLSTFAENINLGQKSYLNWTLNRFRHCFSTQRMATQAILDPEQQATLGEVALATSINAGKLQNARMLIEKHGVALRRYTVKVPYDLVRLSVAELENFKTLVTERHMGVFEYNCLSDEDDKSSYFVINPVACEDFQPVEFVLGNLHACML